MATVPDTNPRRAGAVRAAARLARVAGTALGEGGLTLPQYRVLVFLDAGTRPATQVAALLGVAPSTVTSVVDGLCARDLVLRSKDTADRRLVLLSLTDAGRAALAGGDELVGERLGRLLARLDADAAECVLRGLEHLNAAMEDYLAEVFGSADDPAGPAPRR